MHRFMVQLPRLVGSTVSHEFYGDKTTLIFHETPSFSLLTMSAKLMIFNAYKIFHETFIETGLTYIIPIVAGYVRNCSSVGRDWALAAAAALCTNAPCSHFPRKKAGTFIQDILNIFFLLLNWSFVFFWRNKLETFFLAWQNISSAVLGCTRVEVEIGDN